MKSKTSSRLITDDDILCLIVAGLLKLEGNQVFKWHHSHRRWYALAVCRHEKSGRYKYKIAIGANRIRKIQRSKLHWMIHNRQLVPDGLDIDHEDHDRYNDDPLNLKLRGMSENRSDNWSDGQFAEVANFFDEIARNNANGDF